MPQIQGKQQGFIENKGQMTNQEGKPNKAVQFLMPIGEGMNLQLRKDGFSYDTYTIEGADSKPLQRPANPVVTRFGKNEQVKFRFHRVDISFLGANASPEIIAEEPSFYHYTYASHPGLSAEAFGKVTYKNLYPFIDLVFESKKSDTSGAGAEYYFVIRPGGNANSIQWKYSGALHTSLNKAHIEISVAKGVIKEHIPKSFLQEALSNAKNVGPEHNVVARYRFIGQDTYGFNVPAYPHGSTLVIDPTPDLIWGTYYGDYLDDISYGVAKDASGNLFITGATQDAANIATTGAYQTTMLGNSDAFLGKFDGNGKLLWMTYYGGSSYDEANSVAVDNAGNAVITGQTFSTDHIATSGAYQTQNGGPSWATDAFIAKFTNDGALLWGTYYGGEDIDYGMGIATDASNNVYVCGFTASTKGIATGGAYQPAYGGGTLNDADDGFIARFTPDGAIVWGTYYGGSSFDRCYGIALDNNGGLFVAGPANSQNNIASPGAFQTVQGGNGDGFLAKFTVGGQRVWGTYYGGANDDFALAVTTDSKGNALVAGETQSTKGMTTSGSYQPVFGGGIRDAFLAKFSNDGTRVWSTYYGGEGDEDIYAVAAGPGDDIFITGSTFSTIGIATPGSYQPNGGGAGGVWSTFIAKLDNSSARQWGTYYGYGGPVSQGYGFGLVADPAGNVYVTGETSFPSNISTCGAQQLNWAGNWDIFLAKFGDNPTAALPVIAIGSDKDSVICPDNTVDFTANVQNVPGNYSLQWFHNGIAAGNDTAVFSTNQLAEGDSIRCILILDSLCATGTYSSNSIFIHIDPGLAPSVIISSPLDTICEGDSILVSAAGLNTGANPLYQWMVNGIPTGSDSALLNAKNLATGDKITCMLTRHNACNADSVAESNTIAIYVRPAPAPGISIVSSTDTICSGSPVSFIASAIGTASPSYQWELNGAKVGNDSAIYSSSRLDSGDQVLCILTAEGSVCPVPVVQSNTIIETVFPTPMITIAGDTVIAKGSSTMLTAFSAGDVIAYQWSPDTALSNASIPNPVASPSASTVYTVKAISAEGCASQKTVFITVISKISIPSAFTPNGDGKNDVFRALYGQDISNVHFVVFDRWGQLVFADNGAHKGWDGKLDGVLQPAGTYVWSFEYKDVSGANRNLKGVVELIR